MVAGEIRYRAFISYSHQDRRWAGWLHRALEAYRPPRVPGKGRGGDARLRPIFRDSAELSAGPDLGASIRGALDRSACLILLCSPAALASRWVAAELAHFLETRDADQVFCVIVDGPIGNVLDCLPRPLRDALPAAREPLAIDLRPGRDGRRLARLKLAAGLLGVDLDTLVQRDLRRRVRWMTGITLLALLLSAALGALTVAAVDARRLAQRQAAESEDLVSFMLGDLRGKLEPVGRLDVLDGVGRKVLAHYGRIDSDALDDAALAQQAKALTLLGSISVKRGDLPGAERAFARAAVTSGALSARSPRDGERLFDHAQNVYWLAFVQWRLENLRPAERGFADYARLADALVRIDPARADWRLEPAYARSNLGTLLLEEGRNAEALTAFETARRIFRAASLKAPEDKDRLADLIDAQNWVADASFRLGRLQDAYRERATAAAILHDRLAINSGNRPLEAKAFAADLALARRTLDLGKLTESSTIVARSRAGLARLVAFDRENVGWLEYAVFGDLDATDIALAAGDLPAARSAHAAAVRKIAKLRAVDKASYRWRPQVEGRGQRQAVELAQRTHDVSAMTRAAELLLAQTSASTRKEPGEVATLAGFVQFTLGDVDGAIATLSFRDTALPPNGRDLLARALMRRGKIARATGMVRDLYDSGYRHPQFLAFWKGTALHGMTTNEGED